MIPLPLICPRCRHLNPDTGHLHATRLLLEASSQPALLGSSSLSGASHLTCPTPSCNATYPVIQGIPVIFASPQPLELPANPPLDLFALPVSTQIALLTGRDPHAPLTQLYTRVARQLWSSFRDWTDEIAPPGAEIHTDATLRWVEEHARNLSLQPQRIISLGCGVAREAFSTSLAPVFLLESHLPSLLAAQRLIHHGSLELAVPEDGRNWRTLTLEAPTPPRVEVALLCADAQDPPFEAESADITLALNLIDSVSQPFLALGQSHALTRPGGLLTLSSPFTWRSSITPRERWFESLPPGHGKGPLEVLLELCTHELQPPMHPVAQRSSFWAHRSQPREMVLYESLTLCLKKGLV